MANTDTNWELMLRYAELQQQEYYELLAEWTNYSKSEYKYLKQNIGFAVFGPPSNTEEASTAIDKSAMGDITNHFHYTPNAQTFINAIYDKVREFGEGQVRKECIHFGIIFNMTFRTKNESVEASCSKDKEKNDDKKSETNSKKGKSEADSKKENKENSEEPEINIQSTPIFKVKRRIENRRFKKIEYITWYIDVSARVYKSWSDYLNNNTLPKVTMVVPKDGFYHPDKNYVITEDYSTVWLEVLESPACSLKSNILNVVDTTSNVASAVGLCLGIAGMFTPAAPVAVGAFVATGISGIWSASRSVQHLVDRSVHEESISITDRSALGSWLTVAGSAVGAAASGSTILLTKAAQNGKNISNLVKIAYNTTLVGNLTINGCGIALRAYSIYEKYQEGQGVSTLDVLFVGTHILFFGNAIMNFQLAGDLVESTQGKVLDDYIATLRSKRLRKAFNRAKRTAAENNTDKISENAEVIRYINRKIDLQMKANPNSNNAFMPKNVVSFENGNIIVNGVILLEPMKFVKILLRMDQLAANRFSEQAEDSQAEDVFFKLKDLLITLLTEVFSTSKSKAVPDIDKFNDVFQDMKHMKNATNIFPLLFQISISLAEHVFGPEFIDRAVHFVWSYVKESLRQVCLNATSFVNDSKLQKVITKTIITLFEHLEQFVHMLSAAFTLYINSNMAGNF